VFPPGGTAGSVVEVAVTGSDLDEATSLVFSDPRVSGIPVPGASDRFRVDLPADLAARIPDGLIDVRVRGRYGVSNPRAFAVGSGASELRWTDPPISREKAFELPLESVVSGRVGAQELLWFRFRGKAGQSLGACVEARDLDSKLVPDLILMDASGVEWARGRRREELDFRLPADGDYLLRLSDSQYHGGETHGFRLRITTRPRVAFAVPQVLQAGRSQRVTLYGRRLPGGTVSEVLGSDGQPLEQTTIDIQAPAGSGDASDTVAALSHPAATPLATEAWMWRGEGTFAPLRPVAFGLTSLPVFSGSPTGLVAVVPPCEFSALFPPRGRWSGVTFEAKQGDSFWLELVSERWGHPVDALAVVQKATDPQASAEAANGWDDVLELNDTDENLGDREFSTNHRDASVRWKAPETGRYRIRVRDGFRRAEAQSRYPYRLSLRRESPDFQLAVFPMPPSRVGEDRSVPVMVPVLRRGQTIAFRVVAFRRDGFQGDIELGANGLPSGVRAATTRIASGQNTGVLLLTASVEASGTTPWQVIGKASVGSNSLTRIAWPASVISPVTDYNLERPSARRSRAGSLAVVEAESAPVTIRVGTASVSADGATWKCPLQIERRGEFQGAFNLKAGGHPALEKVKEVSVPEKVTNLVAECSLGEARLPAGTHTLWFQGSVTGKYRQQPEALVVAEAELKAAEQALASATSADKVAAENRKKEAEARRKAAEERAKPRDVTMALWSEPFTVTVGSTTPKETKP
jgi:hypothetical protein